jgi:hypothetical protein
VAHVVVGGKHKASGSSSIRRLKNLRWAMAHVAPPVGPPLISNDIAQTSPRLVPP